jgi:hypothetical protein
MATNFPTILKKSYKFSKEEKATNLLEMALAEQRDYWDRGEKIMIWRNRDASRRAYVQEQNGKVCLFINNFTDHTLVIFEEEVLNGHWYITDNIIEKYHQWIETVKPMIAENNTRTDKMNNQLSNKSNYRIMREVHYEQCR